MSNEPVASHLCMGEMQRETLLLLVMSFHFDDDSNTRADILNVIKVVVLLHYLLPQ